MVARWEGERTEPQHEVGRKVAACILKFVSPGRNNTCLLACLLACLLVCGCIANFLHGSAQTTQLPLWEAHEIWSAGRPPCACEDAVINHDVTIDDEANVRT